ncbi:hypothetical protein N9B17_00135 [Rhodopirellula sp.]|nr:hypothetical protein [Rhodopirellula sp.]
MLFLQIEDSTTSVVDALQDKNPDDARVYEGPDLDVSHKKKVRLTRRYNLWSRVRSDQ